MHHNPLSQEFSARELIKFATPAIAMMVFMSLYVIVDGLFVSHYVGTIALSAINIVYPIVVLFVAFAVMFATGGSALVAKTMGAGDNKEAYGMFSLITIFAIVISSIAAIILYFNIDNFLPFLGADAQTITFCEDYLSILLIFMPMSVIQLLFQDFSITAGRPRLALTLTMLGGFTNIIFDYIFIVKLNMGISGAAYATVLGYSASGIAGLLFFNFNRKGLHLTAPSKNFHSLLKAAGNGSSEMVINVSTSITTLLFNKIMLDLASNAGVAAITAILYFQFILVAFFLGFSIGVAPIISYHHGAKNNDYLTKLRRICFNFVLISSIIIFFIAFSADDFLANAFAVPSDPTYDLILDGVKIFSLSVLFAGFNIFISGMFTALNNGKISALISFGRTFLFLVPSILIMPQILDITGVWLAIPVAEMLTAIVILICYLINRKRATA